MGNIYRSVRPSIDSLTNVIPGKADNALAAAIDLPMMYISGAPLTQAAGSAASMFMNTPIKVRSKALICRAFVPFYKTLKF